MSLLQRFLATGATLSLAALYAGVLVNVVNPDRLTSILACMGLALIALASLGLCLRFIWKTE